MTSSEIQARRDAMADAETHLSHRDDRFCGTSARGRRFTTRDSGVTCRECRAAIAKGDRWDATISALFAVSAAFRAVPALRGESKE